MILKTITILYVLSILLLPVSGNGQDVVINEVVSSNLTINTDQDGDYEDWIELFNTSNLPVNLEGFSLSDDSTNLMKWVFPEVALEPQNYLLVWASGKDRRPAKNSLTNGLVRQVYKNIGGDKLDSLLSNPKYPNQPDNVEVITDLFEAPKNVGDNYGQRMSSYILAPATGEYTFWISGDDNSQLFLSSSMNPDSAVQIAEVPVYSGSRGWNKFPEQKSAKINLEAGKYYYIAAIMKEKNGGDHLAVQWQLPDNSMESPIPVSRLFYKNSELHTNFSIKSSGEEIFLVNPAGEVIDNLPPTEINVDYSVGRFPDGTGNWELLYAPSPAAKNLETIYAGQCEMPVFLTAADYYRGTIDVEFTTATPNATMYYTTNGAVPSEKSAKLEGPIIVSKTTTIRVRAFAPDLQPSKIATGTYFINENFTFPVVSVTTDPYNLYDSEYGIFPGGDPYWESNLFQDWERPIHFQFFESDKTPIVNMDAGVKVHGGLTRGVEGKSLAIMARTEYGSDSINHKFFAEKELASFKNLVLRNGGNDYNYAIFRDCFMQDLVRNNMDLDLSGSRPAVVFLNGEYWGIRDIKEKMNEHFIARNFNIDTDDIDMLEYVHHNAEVQEMNGSAEHFNKLIEFIATNTLTNDENYKTVERQIDINNFIQYQVAQIYYDNSDWPGNNIKWWRQSKPESKYRWLLFDTDFGFSLSPFGNETGDELLHYKHNTLGIATDPDGDEWPNPPHSTFLFRSLLENEMFRNQFINTFCDHLNTTFQPERVVEILNEYIKLFEPEMERHRQRFPSSKSWTKELTNMKTFGEKRPQYIYPHLMQKFKLTRNKTITLNVDDAEKGNVGINSIVCQNYPWEGKYFPNVPITVRAIAKPGFKFERWSDGNTSEIRKIDVQNTSELTAIFEQSTIESTTIVINEINYNSAPDFDTDDWVELLNSSESWADIGNWVFKDGNDEHQFIFPAGTLIAPGKTVVLCNDRDKFLNYNPTIENTFGNIDFGFSSSGEYVRLYNSSGILIDSVNYGISNPWPDLSDFEGHTLQLIDADLDNVLAESWEMSEEIGGNPGLDNSGITDAVDYYAQENISSLSQNYPNPFRKQTTINYQLAETSPTIIRVIDFTGRTIKVLVNETQSAGNYSVDWDGRNQNGQVVKSDIYFLQMVSGKTSETIKMIKME